MRVYLIGVYCTEGLPYEGLPYRGLLYRGSTL